MMTNIAIMDVDGKMPNIPLMKIARYHKNVDWFIPGMNPDRLYVSKLFNFSPDYLFNIDGEIIKGGTGFNVQSKLSIDIEEEQPDYSIYPNCNYSVQFYSRGCIRKCPFCVISEKEGSIKSVLPMNLNPKGEWIEVFDNNFFANPNWWDAVSDLRSLRQRVNLHGVDVRILTEDMAWALNILKHKKQIHIAWDNPKEDLTEKLKEVTQWIKPYKLMCYVLIGYWSTEEEDLERVKILRGLGIDPFVMSFNKNDDYQRAFARWVNHKATFKSTSWENYRG